MFKNRKFTFYAVTLCLTGLLYAFLCAGLDGGRMQIIRSVITPDGGGWRLAQIELPMTVGSFLAAPLAFICCGAFLRSGVRQTLIPCTAAAALGCVGLVCANGLDIFGGAAAGHYWLFALSLAVIRCACILIQTALAALCLQWFIRFRGRALGVVFMGAPLFSAIGAAALANFVRTVLGGDHRPFYMGAAVLLGLLALVARFLLRDRPEETGLYPDGDGRAPASEPDEEEPPMSLAQVLKDSRTWLALIALGALAFAAAGGLSFLEPRLLAKGSGGPTLLDRAAPWLALGSILAIPASYIFGWLCDRLGSLWTALLLGLTELASIYLLWHFPKEVTLPNGVALCLAAACLMSGAPVVVPCVIGHTFGRPRSLAACRAIFPWLLLVTALTGPLGALLGGGTRSRLYVVLFAAVCLGLTACLALLAVCRFGKRPKDKDKE